MNKANLDQILSHFKSTNQSFKPSLDSYCDIELYSQKIYYKAFRFEKFDGDSLVGLLAFYVDREEKTGFITNLSVCEEFKGKDIAEELLDKSIFFMFENGVDVVNLRVFEQNMRAISFYTKQNFTIIEKLNNHYKMSKKINKRNFDLETADTSDHKYAYSFDFDHMHHYMLRTLRIYWKDDACILELGSYRGDFTEKLLEEFKEIVCIEASEQAASFASERFESRVEIINSMFEECSYDGKHKNVILTHVLEHLDKPSDVLRLIGQWLDDDGVFCIVCPNANAASRQIAVNGGILDYNHVITPAETAHGHTATYSLDTLVNVVRSAGLDVVDSGGIFFKPLANFQLDKLIGDDLLSEEYLEGCYQLGSRYPDLCSSIFVVAQKSS